MIASPFLSMLETLRKNEEILLSGHLAPIGDAERSNAIRFLAQEYQTEILEYPYEAPAFNGEAAFWAAETVNVAAQLLLQRNTVLDDLPALFPAYKHTITADAVLSADLTLRFLPAIIRQLHIFDPEDSLIPLLESVLKEWHYSAVGYFKTAEDLNFEPIAENDCLLQLYVNRVIEAKLLAFATHDVLQSAIQASLSFYATDLWNDFNREISQPHE